MKATCAFSVFSVLLTFVTVHLAPSEKYTTKYDTFEVDRILAQPRLIRNSINCALDKGPCVKETILLKENIPESLENDCVKCSERQRITAKRIIQYLVVNETESFLELTAKFDPEGKYKEKYKQEAAELGITLLY